MKHNSVKKLALGVFLLVGVLLLQSCDSLTDAVDDLVKEIKRNGVQPLQVDVDPTYVIISWGTSRSEGYSQSKVYLGKRRRAVELKDAATLKHTSQKGSPGGSYVIDTPSLPDYASNTTYYWLLEFVDDDGKTTNFAVNSFVTPPDINKMILGKKGLFDWPVAPVVDAEYKLYLDLDEDKVANKNPSVERIYSLHSLTTKGKEVDDSVIAAMLLYPDYDASKKLTYYWLLEIRYGENSTSSKVRSFSAGDASDKFN